MKYAISMAFIILGIVFLAVAVYYYPLALDSVATAFINVLAFCGIAEIAVGIHLMRIKRRK